MNENWPEHVKRIFLKGQAWIEQLRKQFDEAGILILPFRCYGCDEMRSDFAMMTGDGVPMCNGCINRFTDTLEGKT